MSNVVGTVKVLSGMGAISHANGTAFRVWAPFAAEMYVTGSFNAWASDQFPMQHEGNGYWYVDVPLAKVDDEYEFIIVNQQTGQIYRRNDPYARAVTNSVGKSIIVSPEFNWTDQDFQMPGWNELIILEIHPGTLIPGKRQSNPPTFRELIPRLKVAADRGINVIELMPLCEFAGDISWGYNPADLFAVESAYGGPQALKEFVNAAHRCGIAVILDVVYNHLGPSDLDLWQFDGWSENDKGGIYFYNDWRSKTPWGDTRPDYGRPEVRQFILDNALMWLTEYHIDGLRWDSVVNIRTLHNGNGGEIAEGWSLMQWVNQEIKARFPNKITIAEDLQSNEWVTKDTGAGGAGFDTQWDGRFVHTIRDAVITPVDADRDMDAVRDAITFRFNGDAFERVIYTESHDEDANGHQRVPEEIWPGNADSWYSKKRSTLGAAIVFTSPGIPMMFQGQTVLENKWFTDTNPLDLDKFEQFAGIGWLYRDLMRLRRNWYNQTRGLRCQWVNVFHVNNTDKVIAYHRWEHGGPGDDVIVVANFADRSYDSYPIGFPRDGYWQVRFNSDWNGYSPDFGNHLSYDTTAGGAGRDGLPFQGNIGIGPYTAVILSQ